MSGLLRIIVRPAFTFPLPCVKSRATQSETRCRKYMAAIDDWLDSGRKLVSLRDHAFHYIPVMGGMWGGRTNAIPDIAKRLDVFKQNGRPRVPIYADNSFVDVVHEISSFESHCAHTCCENSAIQTQYIREDTVRILFHY